ncbi:MAG: methionine--tRNA ligase [Candidatus Paceibacterota bacterium]
MNNPGSKILIGLAWPYANGSLHLGHASAFICADVLARYHRLRGDDVLFVSGSDCFGTPIAVEALEKGIDPSEIANYYHDEFVKTLIDGLNFSYDNYTKTTSPTHQRVVQGLFLKLYERGYLYTKTESALFSPHLDRFLPDRFVEGTCPHCKLDGARGDQCDNCGKLLDPLDLINPRINKKILKHDGLSAADMALEQRESEHFYLKLSSLTQELENWIAEVSDSWRLNARTFAVAFLRQGLKDRAITRDTNWGVPIPLPGYEEKRIYVWFEAVIGYFSASVEWAEKKGQPDAWQDWWHTDNAKHYYVHGKDNIPFHTIIWPGILKAEGSLHMPDQIVSSEFLNLEDKQFSKSRKWAVWLPEFLNAFDGELLRYFLITNGPENNDTSFKWQEFQNKVNGELIGTYANFVNRVLSFTQKHFPQGVSCQETLDGGAQDIIASVEKAFDDVGQYIEAGEFRKAYKRVLNILEDCNRHIDTIAPWKLIKDKSNVDEVAHYLALYVHIIENVSILFSPFTPHSSEHIMTMTQSTAPDKWEYRPLRPKYSATEVITLYRKIENEEIDGQKEKLG